jgi:hypothetical protein
MEATVKLESVLDLIRKHQEELAVSVDEQSNGTISYRVLWDEYKHVSKLYDDIRRAAE